MKHDYYLSNMELKEFQDWNKEKENSFGDNRKKRKWMSIKSDEKQKKWLEEVYMVSLGQIKNKILMKIKENNIYNEFYPFYKCIRDDFKKLPQNSILIKISFSLKKAYTSKGEGEFHINNKRIFENPIVRDKFTGMPMVRPSSWKGHLRFAAEKVEVETEKRNGIISRLFGSEPNTEDLIKGRLYFFPTFFKDNPENDIITPLDRERRIPARGPINLEIIKPNKDAEFYILYFPYPKNNEFNEKEVKEDLEFLADAIKLMLYFYGFSAKKTSGFGVIKENLNEGRIWINPDKLKEFSNLKVLKEKLRTF